MPILNAWVLSTLAAALGEALLDVLLAAAPGGETHCGDGCYEDHYEKDLGD